MHICSRSADTRVLDDMFRIFKRDVRGGVIHAVFSKVHDSVKHYTGNLDIGVVGAIKDRLDEEHRKPVTR